MLFKILQIAGLVFCTVQTTFADTYFFSAPPRESAAEGQRIYTPISDYLSELTGHDFKYQHPGNWPAYLKDIQTSKYDLLFDGPHFISWRVEKIEHTPLVRLPGDLQYVVIARTADQQVQGLQDLKGYIVCAHAPPNLATLTLFDQYENTWTQPQIRSARGFTAIYQGLLDQRCKAAVLPLGLYKKFSVNQPDLTRVLFQSLPLPHQGFSAGPRIPHEIQLTIREVLLKPESADATRLLRERFAANQLLIATDQDEYRGYGYLLEDYWGF